MDTQPNIENSSSTQASYQQSEKPALLSERNKMIGVGVILLIAVLGLFITLFPMNSSKQPGAKISPTVEILAPTAATAVNKGGSYASSVYGFQFDYPEQFFAKNVSSDIISISSLGTVADPDEPATGLQMTISKGDNGVTNLSKAKDLFQTPVIKDLTVGGAPAKELSGLGKGIVNGKFVRFVEVFKNGQTVEFAYFEGEPEFTPEIFNNLLLNFKFTR